MPELPLTSLPGGMVKQKRLRWLRLLLLGIGGFGFALVLLLVALGIYETKREIPESAGFYMPGVGSSSEHNRSGNLPQDSEPSKEEDAQELVGDMNATKGSSHLGETPSIWISSFEDLLSIAREYEEEEGGKLSISL